MQNIFRGDCEARQLEKIFQICGTPDEIEWPGVTKLPYYNELFPKPKYANKLKEYMLSLNKEIDNISLDLLQKLLNYNPKMRISA